MCSVQYSLFDSFNSWDREGSSNSSRNNRRLISRVTNQLHVKAARAETPVGLPPFEKKLRDSQGCGWGLTVWGRGSERVSPC